MRGVKRQDRFSVHLLECQDEIEGKQGALMKAAAVLVTSALLLFPLAAAAQQSKQCLYDQSSQAGAQKWSRVHGFAVGNAGATCGPTAVANMDILLRNYNPQTGFPPPSTPPGEVQDQMTKCLTEAGFYNPSAGTSLIVGDGVAAAICSCNEKITGKKWTCEMSEFAAGAGFWGNLEKALDQGCGAICIATLAGGGGHVFTVDTVDGSKMTMIEPAGGVYTLEVSDSSPSVGQDGDKYHERLRKAGIKGVQVESCVSKCLAPSPQVLPTSSVTPVQAVETRSSSTTQEVDTADFVPQAK